MTKKWKRLLTSFLSVAMLMSVVSLNAYAAEEDAPETEITEEAPDTEPVPEEEPEAPPQEAVATLDGEPFATLQEALDAAGENGGEVVLEEDVAEEVRFMSGVATLNLGDYTITGSVTNEADLTITAGDGGIEQVDGSAIINHGSMEIDGGTYTMSTSSFGKTIDNKEGDLTIIDADVTASGGNRAYAIYSMSTLTVENGTYRALNASYGHAIYITDSASAYIQGGSMEGKTCGIYISSNSNVTISGGNVTGGSNAVEQLGSDGTILITGGTFNTDVSEYVDADRVLIETDDGYTVESADDLSVSLDQAALTLQVSATAQLNVDVTPQGAQVVWSTSDPAVVTVEDGLVAAVAEGKATITAAVGSVRATCLVTVEKEPEPVQVQVSLNKTTLSLRAGGSETLIATVEPEGAEVTWSSDNQSVATVDANGVITAVAAGTATIKAEVEGGSAQCIVTVTRQEPENPGSGSGSGSGPGSGSGSGSGSGNNSGGSGSGSGSGTVTTPPVEEEDLIDEETPLAEKPFLFKDVSTKAWYYEAVKYVYNADMMGAMNRAGDSFGPAAVTTRGMVVTILWRLEGEPGAQKTGFNDIIDGQWYSEAVAWGVSKGIVKGYNAVTFGPNNSITREELAVILYRYAQMKGYNTEVKNDLSRFDDAGRVHSWAREAMGWAVGTGLMQGSGGNLNPQGSAVRCEVAQMLMRFCKTFPVKGAQ